MYSSELYKANYHVQTSFELRNLLYHLFSYNMKAGKLSPTLNNNSYSPRMTKQLQYDILSVSNEPWDVPDRYYI